MRLAQPGRISLQCENDSVRTDPEASLAKFPDEIRQLRRTENPIVIAPSIVDADKIVPCRMQFRKFDVAFFFHHDRKITRFRREVKLFKFLKNPDNRVQVPKKTDPKTRTRHFSGRLTAAELQR
jgi:hypothetical protein